MEQGNVVGAMRYLRRSFYRRKFQKLFLFFPYGLSNALEI